MNYPEGVRPSIYLGPMPSSLRYTTVDAGSRDDVLARMSAEVNDLRRVVQNLDGERDSLQVCLAIWRSGLKHQ